MLFRSDSAIDNISLKASYPEKMCLETGQKLIQNEDYTQINSFVNFPNPKEAIALNISGKNLLLKGTLKGLGLSGEFGVKTITQKLIPGHDSAITVEICRFDKKGWSPSSMELYLGQDINEAASFWETIANEPNLPS